MIKRERLKILKETAKVDGERGGGGNTIEELSRIS